MGVKVSKIFTFHAGHYLPGYPGKCSRPHGHTFILEVEVSGPVGDDGFVIDFSVLEKFVNTLVIEPLDHYMLNDRGFLNPTCEIVASWILESLREAVKQYNLNPIEITRVRLYETPSSYAEVD